MRPPERIDNFLVKVDWNTLMDRWGIDKEFIKRICYATNPTIVEYWKENPDQRIGQVLINLNLLPDKLNIWTDEESDILIDQGIPPREVYFWTSYYDKDMQRLPEPKRKLIKDLDYDHLNNIIKHFKECLVKPPELIMNEVSYRNGQ